MNSRSRKGVTHQKDRGQEKVLLRARKSGFLASGKNHWITLEFICLLPFSKYQSSMSAYSAAPVTHQDLGRLSSPTVLRRPDNLRSHAMSKVLLQISWLRTNPLLAHVVVGETKSSEKLEALATNQISWLCQPQCWFPTASKFMQNISRDQSSRPPA